MPYLKGQCIYNLGKINFTGWKIYPDRNKRVKPYARPNFK